MWYLYEESKFVNCFQAIVEGIALVDAKKIGGGEIGRYKAPWGRKRKRGVRGFVSCKAHLKVLLGALL